MLDKVCSPRASVAFVIVTCFIVIAAVLQKASSPYPAPRCPINSGLDTGTHKPEPCSRLEPSENSKSETDQHDSIEAKSHSSISPSGGTWLKIPAGGKVLAAVGCCTLLLVLVLYILLFVFRQQSQPPATTITDRTLPPKVDLDDPTTTAATPPSVLTICLSVALGVTLIGGAAAVGAVVYRSRFRTKARTFKATRPACLPFIPLVSDHKLPNTHENEEGKWAQLEPFLKTWNAFIKKRPGLTRKWLTKSPLYSDILADRAENLRAIDIGDPHSDKYENLAPLIVSANITYTVAELNRIWSMSLLSGAAGEPKSRSVLSGTILALASTAGDGQGTETIESDQTRNCAILTVTSNGSVKEEASSRMQSLRVITFTNSFFMKHTLSEFAALEKLIGDIMGEDES